MAMRLFTERTGAMMVAMGSGDDGDDLPVRTEIPAFPWHKFRRALILSGAGHATNTRMNPTPMIVHRDHNRIPYPVVETSEHGPLLTAVARAFNESYRRHNLTPAHWRVLVGCEAGMVYRTVKGHAFTDKEGKTYQQTADGLCVYRPERPDAVVPYGDAPAVLDVREDLARRYHQEAKRAVEDEWRWLHSGFER
jgi:hypothetical protein